MNWENEDIEDLQNQLELRITCFKEIFDKVHNIGGVKEM